MKLFQINEADLGSLEELLPELMEADPRAADSLQRKRWEECRNILSRVRWNYGPPRVLGTDRDNDENPDDTE